MNENPTPKPTHGKEIIEINLDGPQFPPPGKPNPKPIPPGGHSLLPGKPADASMAPVPLTQPDPLCAAACAADLIDVAPATPKPASKPAADPDTVSPDEHKALIEEAQKLQPEQLQAFLELISRQMKRKKDEFNLPDLPITDEDKDKISDTLAYGKPYAEKFFRAKNKLIVVFRDQLGEETDLIYDQLRQDARDGLITEEWDWSTRLNKYNLLVQMYELNGVVQPRAIPPRQARPADFSLRTTMENSLIGQMPSPRIYILLAVLSQFDKKIRMIANQILKEDEGF